MMAWSRVWIQFSLAVLGTVRFTWPCNLFAFQISLKVEKKWSEMFIWTKFEITSHWHAISNKRSQKTGPNYLSKGSYQGTKHDKREWTLHTKQSLRRDKILIVNPANKQQLTEGRNSERRSANYFFKSDATCLGSGDKLRSRDPASRKEKKQTWPQGDREHSQ